MSLVTSEGSRRIGPKVFADVPSAGEVAAVRRSRNWLAIILLLALGALLAIGYLVMTLTDQVERADGRNDEEVAELKLQLESRDRELAEFTKPEYGLRELVNRIEETNRLRTAIGDKLAGRVPPHTPPASLVTGTVFDTPWSWDRLRRDAIAELDAELDGRPARPGQRAQAGLRATETLVNGWRPARPVPPREQPGVRANPGQ